jgi:hypothetical protein
MVFVAAAQWWQLSCIDGVVCGDGGGCIHQEFAAALTCDVISVVEGRWENDKLVRAHATSRVHKNQHSQLDHHHQHQHHQDQHGSPSIISARHHDTHRHHYTLSPLLHPSLPSPHLRRPFTPSHMGRHVTHHGTIDSPGGSMYVGEMRDTTSHGNGTRIFPDGSRYDGEWKGGVSCSIAGLLLLKTCLMAIDLSGR